MKQNHYIYYGNGGCGNHGCEAIVRSLERILQPNSPSISLSSSCKEDKKYGLDNLIGLRDLSACSKLNREFINAYIDLKLNNFKYAIDLFPYKHFIRRLKNKDKYLALSVGGDNYCYGGTQFYAILDSEFHNKNVKTAMVGCSIEPDVISEPNVRNDLKSHSIIIARESLTFEALKKESVENSVLLPDPAFALKPATMQLPDGFIDGNTVGINISPVVNRCSKGNNAISVNTDCLINHLIDSSDMQIALIPHVVWPQCNDFDVLRPLYEKYKDTGRVIMIEDCGAEVLKGYISHCRFLIAARTHASIAAYSTGVPTLVIGYSVKSKGIAKDIFGTYENYVLPAQSFSNDTELIKGFRWLMENEISIREHLKSFMPDYCKKTFLIKDALESIN